MAEGINIRIGSETREFEQGIKRGVITPLEGAEKAFKEFDKSGDTDTIQKSLQDAQRETKEFSAEYKTMASEVRSAGKRMDTDFELSTREKRKLTKEAIKEVGDEAKQNAAETFSSFDGSAQSFVDGIQGTLGGLVASMGPIGLAAGAAGALAIGLINGALQNADTTSQEFKQDVGELTQEFIDAGQFGPPAVDRLITGLKKLATETDASKQSLRKIRDEAKDTGQDFSDLADAFAGDPKAVHEAIKLTKTQLKAAEDLATGTIQGGKAVDRAEQFQAQQKASRVKDQLSDLEAIDKKNKEAADNEALYAQTSAAADQAKLDAIESAKAAREDEISSLQSGIDDAIGSFGDFKDEESGALDPAAYIAGIQSRIDATTNFNTNVQNLATQFGLSQDEIQTIIDQGVDFAPMLQAIIDSGMAPQFVEEIRKGVGGGQDILNGTPLEGTVTVNEEPAQKSIRQLMDEKRETAPIDAKADTKAAEKQLDEVTDKKRQADIQAVASTWSADQALTALANRTRTATIKARVVDQYGRVLN